MDKVIKLLEKNVQWFALGLALLYVGYTAYTYLVEVPLHVSVGTPAKDCTPGEVDPQILHTTADMLEKKMKDPKIVTPHEADVLAQFTAGIGRVADVTVASNWPTPVDSPYRGTGLVVTNPNGGGPIVNALPKFLPAAMPDKPTSKARWTVIMVPGPAAPTPAPVPGQPAPVAQPVSMLRQDVAYWSGTFQMDDKALDAALQVFNQPNLPPMIAREFVRVQLLREELGADGATWSKPILIATLPIHQMAQYPGDIKPQPAAADLKKVYYTYKAWEEANQDIIVHPAFYQTASDAEPWQMPGTTVAPVAPSQSGQVPGPVVAQRPFDPSRDTPRTPEERAQYQQYQQAKMQAMKERNMRRPGMPGMPTPGGFAPPPYPGRPAPPPLINPGGQNPQPFLPQPGVGPNGFNPGLPVGNSQILVHDTTIQEGKTYRYAVRYKLYNPMFDKPAWAVAAVAARFDMDSIDPAADAAALKQLDPNLDPEKLWTEKVKVEPTAHIYVQKIDAFRSSVDFVVYTWKNGKWQDAPATKMSPGDPVRPNSPGGAKPEPTPWTVVDVRTDPHTKVAYVLLMDDKGIITARDVASDQQDPKYQELKTAVGGAAAMAR